MTPKANQKKRILITAGPTREKLDPVRFISNYSTGFLGYEIAREAKRTGHSVTLISGPTALSAIPGIRLISVESAADMRREVLKWSRSSEIIIMAAAVSDWRPAMAASKKLKKGRGRFRVIRLAENLDILAELGRKKRGKVLVGFALETEDLEKNALKKLKNKNLDLIVTNRLSPAAALFGDNTVEEALIIDRLGKKTTLSGRSKKAVAKIVLDKALNIKI